MIFQVASSLSDIKKLNLSDTSLVLFVGHGGEKADAFDGKRSREFLVEVENELYHIQQLLPKGLSAQQQQQHNQKQGARIFVFNPSVDSDLSLPATKPASSKFLILLFRAYLGRRVLQAYPQPKPGFD